LTVKYSNRGCSILFNVVEHFNDIIHVVLLQLKYRIWNNIVTGQIIIDVNHRIIHYKGWQIDDKRIEENIYGYNVKNIE
jgi:hypothetical protein